MTERERASVARVGGKRAMSKPRRTRITRVVETEEGERAMERETK